jgi:hypothetical protein
MTRTELETRLCKLYLKQLKYLAFEEKYGNRLLAIQLKLSDLEDDYEDMLKQEKDTAE